MTAEEWRITNEASGLVEEDVYDLEVTDAVNRFARNAKVTLIDYDGVKHLDYNKGTPVTIDVDDGSGYFTRWGGFVTDIERDEDTTTLILYSHDLWLRRREVLRNYEDQTIASILEDIITSLTPLTWDAGMVEVLNNKTISRRWQGERLDEVIEELASMSGNENFGGTNDAEFFFRPRETSSAPFDLDEDRFTKAKFDNKGKKDVNQVTVFFGEDPDTGAVTIADLEAQQDLADELGRPRPVVIATNTNFPEITFDSSVSGSKQEAEESARRKGQKILQGRTGVLKGRVTSWGGFNAFAGDVIYCNIPRQDIDGEFRIAEIKYNYLSGETVMQLAENTEGVIDTLINMSQEMTRIDLRGADAEVTPTQFIKTTNPIEFEVTLSVIKIPVADNQMLWGYPKGGWGHPDIGGGLWGDQRGEPETII